jgi:hypothetical protein
MHWISSRYFGCYSNAILAHSWEFHLFVARLLGGMQNSYTCYQHDETNDIELLDNAARFEQTEVVSTVVLLCTRVTKPKQQQ